MQSIVSCATNVIPDIFLSSSWVKFSCKAETTNDLLFIVASGQNFFEEDEKKMMMMMMKKKKKKKKKKKERKTSGTRDFCNDHYLHLIESKSREGGGNTVANTLLVCPN